LALLLIPQAFVTAGWQLVGLRFLMGLALGGLLPCVASLIRHNVPANWILRTNIVDKNPKPMLSGAVEQVAKDR
jgi:MFS family permease